MKDEFFEKILNVADNRPFLTTVARDGQLSQAIAQIREGEHGELAVVLQKEVGPLLGSDDTETTIALPNFRYGPPSGVIANSRGLTDTLGERTLPLYPSQARPFADFQGESTRTINGESITLVKPVKAKTLTLWYENIWAEVGETNVSAEAVTVSHGGRSSTEIPPYGSVEFFVEVRKPETGQPSIEWDIGDTHQGVIVRTNEKHPFVKISIRPADDRDIAWGEYVARIWFEHEHSLDVDAAKDVGFHVWRNDEADMNLDEINRLEQVLSHSLSFTNSAWCRPKVAIAWQETWSDSQWWATWTPVWGSWKPTPEVQKNRHENWTPKCVAFKKVLRETLMHVREADYGLIERYVHNVRAMDHGDWISSVTASVAILQRIANNEGFNRERCGPELWKQIVEYLKSKAIEVPYHYVGWGAEAERLIKGGDPHENLVRAITELRNHATGHWLKDDAPDHAPWLAQQALYYVEAVLRAELAPSVPMWDRARAFHHPPILD